MVQPFQTCHDRSIPLRGTVHLHSVLHPLLADPRSRVQGGRRLRCVNPPNAHRVGDKDVGCLWGRGRNGCKMDARYFDCCAPVR